MTFALGVVSALAAPLCIVIGFMAWDNYWTGSPFALNLYKCNLATIGFTIVLILTKLLPEGYQEIYNSEDVINLHFTIKNVGFLMLSSVLGILLGDFCWLEGMRVLGARKLIVIDSLKPCCAAIFGYYFLNEVLNIYKLSGLVITTIGVVMVGLERAKAKTLMVHHDLPPHESDALLAGEELLENRASYSEERKRKQLSTSELCYGLIVSVSNVIFHTLGASITKIYATDLTTWEICWIRFGFAGLCMMAISFGFYMQRSLLFVKSNPVIWAPTWYLLPKATNHSWWCVSVGVMFVSFCQPALTNYALFQISLALLMTLESIGPLYSLPLAFVVEKEAPTSQATAGAVLAVAGIAILSFT